jgi:hypothetical protein
MSTLLHECLLRGVRCIDQARAKIAASSPAGVVFLRSWANPEPLALDRRVR